MNLDIVSSEEGLDLGVAVTTVAKAGNVLSIQLGSLEYAPDFGVDLRYFLESPIRFQNSSFQAYLVERLAVHQIAVTDIVPEVESLFHRLTFRVDDHASVGQTGFIG